MRAEVKALPLEAVLETEEDRMELEEELLKLGAELLRLTDELLAAKDELLENNEELLALEEELPGPTGWSPPQATSAARGIATPPVLRARSNPDMYLLTNIDLLSYKN